MTRMVFLLALGSMVVLAGCSKPRPPTITPDTTTITSVSPAGLGVRATLDVTNPNDFSLSTQAVTATISVGDKVKLGPVTKPHGVSLPANQTTKVEVDLAATWNQAAELAQLAVGELTIPFVVEGKVALGGKSLNVQLPFRIEGTVSRAQLLSAGIKGLPSIPGLPLPLLPLPP
ncbi:MAG: LEA type 2 family protein [Polyangiaceae bacterium]|jgi:LEA14-like dessication related protein|nr:LEA type 2 family protein [Polyangiaceae bacterium]